MVWNHFQTKQILARTFELHFQTLMSWNDWITEIRPVGKNTTTLSHSWLIYETFTGEVYSWETMWRHHLQKLTECSLHTNMIWSIVQNLISGSTSKIMELFNLTPIRTDILGMQNGNILSSLGLISLQGQNSVWNIAEVVSKLAT